ncbi:DNA internalization-related competence protein ComEC/Rec2 [Glaciecola petra]|uniref:DNA internalization-related competence protein ComEC/Rec2 n=1 Tax=Glaciecola petra TaxID=3075602 RepID=A0ABU2ZST7_9ALTE|nr:DNA internalization-related competence protein ComEC/Rec2 [Aestuariibacter sp. P117]MDT0594487.1 DNA internalization-related competence protein ComEC/Rec2 [Aestuariibacter sp. P117]
MYSINDKAMLSFIIIFCSSALWPKLPSITLLLCAICVLIFCYAYSLSAILQAGLIAFLWASSVAYYYLYWQIDKQYFEQNTLITGTITSLSSIRVKHLSESDEDSKKTEVMHSKSEIKRFNKNHNTVFNIKIDTLGNQSLWLKPSVRISWYAPSFDISQGNKVRLLVKLKPPNGLANPDGFDYHRWLVSKNISATGYVKDSPSNQLMLFSPSVRQNWITGLSRQHQEYMPWLIALTYGDKRYLSADDWLLIQQTGTAHLFAISGMHLGIVAGFVLVVLKGMLLLIALLFNVKQINLQHLNLFICCIACSFYAYIAGFEIPVLRALIALFIISIVLNLQCYWRPVSVFLFVICLFLVLFPFSILSVSFWFSFGAVSLILFYLWRFPELEKNNRKQPHTWLYLVYFKFKTIFKLQVFLSLVTLPFVLFVYGTLPLVAVPANLFMLPIVSFILVPACLIIALLISVGLYPSGLLSILNEALALSINMLKGINRFATFQPSLEYLSALDYAALTLFMFVCLLPKWPTKTKWCLSLFLCYSGWQILCYQQYYFSRETRVYVFDVGQGSAAIVQSKPSGSMLSNYAIFDTGGAYRGSFSMAKSALSPFLEKRKQNKIDFLLLSHLDNDHAGGKEWLTKQYVIEEVFAPNNLCGNKNNKYWSGLAITILWPLSPQSGDENDHSCVARISNGENSILFTGDIEKNSEQAIVETYKNTNLLQVDVLIAPHHGSQTSSTKAFVEAVQAKHVIFTAGFNNRWKFPKQEILNRYNKNDASTLITGRDGRILINIETLEVSAYLRHEHQRWYRQRH